MADSKAAPAAAPAPAKKGFMKQNPLIMFGIAVLFGLLVFVLPINLSHEAKVTLALLGFTAAMWVFEVMPVGITSVLFVVLLMITLGSKIMPARTAFAGFANNTLWLMLGAFLLGEACVQTGLAKRIAFTLMKRGGASYNRIIIYLWIAGCVLGLLVPSGTVRVAMFIPIMVGIVEAYKAPSTSNFATNLLLHVYWSSILGSTIWYTGTNMNPTAMGIAQGITGYAPSYMVWVLWMIIPSIFLFLGCYLIIQWCMKPEKEILANAGSSTVIQDELNTMGAMNQDERRSLYFFLAAIILWMTEPFHGIETSLVAILIATLLFLPKVGILKGKSLNKVSWDTILLLGVALSFGNIIGAVKLDTWIVDTLMRPILDPFSGSTLGLAFAICILIALVHFIMASSSAETAMMTPLIGQYAQANGLNVTLAAMAVARTAQNVFIFPYQTLPLVVLWGTGYMDMKKCLKSMGLIALFNVVWISLMGPYLDWMMKIVM